MQQNNLIHLSHMFKARFPKRFALPMILGLLTMYSCSEKDYYDPNYGGGKKDNPLDVEVPADMDWNMLSTANITVDVNDDEYSDEFYYKVEILSNNPFEGKTYQTIDAGVAKKGQPYTAKVEYAKGKQNTFYIRKTSPVGRVSIQPYTIAEEEEIPVTRSAVSNANYQVGTKSTSSFSYDTSGAIELTDLNTELQSNKKYIISGELTGAFKLYNLNRGNATIFIKGKWKNKEGQNLQNVDIVILKSGEVEGKVIVADKASLTISSGGEVDADHVEAQGNGKIENYGKIDADEFIVNNSNSTIYNKADAKIEGKILKFTGGTLQNDGTIDFNKFSPDGGDGTFINNCQAFFDNNDECKMAGSIKVTLNKGVIAKDYEDGKYEPIENFICEGSCSITMNDGSMIKAKEASIKGSGSIISDGKHNLLKVIETLKLSGAPKLSGELTIEHNNLVLENGIILPNGIVQCKPGQSTVIISTCGGEEIPDENPNPPTNPTFPIEITTSTDYIYAMEDQWPYYGDYDMNDVVVGVSPQITNYIYSDRNAVKQIKFDIRLLSVGALKQIAAAIQLEKVTPEQVENVEYIGNIKDILGTSFYFGGNGVEANQEKAVVALFENANKLLGGNFVNVGRQDEVTPVEFTVVVNFKDNANIKPGDLGYKDLNFFIIPDLSKTEAKQRRPEIHLGGYNPTNLANPDLFEIKNTEDNGTKKYISNGNMVWGLIIPTKEWKCPDESVSIIDAYPRFKEWVTTGGKQSADWYKGK